MNNCPECKPSNLTIHGEKKLRAEIEQWREWFEEYQLDISMAAQGASPANLEQAVEATRDCFICGGDGVVYDAKCDNCDGTGIQPETTKNSSGLSDFIRNASPEEKERVYEKVIDEANEAQRKLTEQVSHYRDPSSVSDEGFDAACLGHLPPDERD